MDAQLLNLAANRAADLGADDTNDDDIPSIINDNQVANQDDQDDQDRTNQDDQDRANQDKPERQNDVQRPHKRRRDGSQGESSSSSISSGSTSSGSNTSTSSGRASPSKRRRPSNKPPKKDDNNNEVSKQDASQEPSEEDLAADRAQAIEEIFEHWQRTRSLPLIKVAGSDNADFYQALEGVPHDTVMRQQAMINNTSYEKMFMDGVYFCIWYASKGLAMLSEYLVKLTKGWFPDFRLLPMAIEAREYEFKCALRRLYRTLFPKSRAGGKLHPGLELLSLFAMTCMTVPLLTAAGNKFAPVVDKINNFVSNLNTNGPAFVDHNINPSSSTPPGPTPPSNPLFGPPSSTFSFSQNMQQQQQAQQQQQQAQQQGQQGSGLVDMLGKMASSFGLDMNAISKVLSGITQTAQTPTTTVPVQLPDDLDSMPDVQPLVAQPLVAQPLVAQPSVENPPDVTPLVAPSVALPPKNDERPMFGEMDSLNTINSS